MAGLFPQVKPSTEPGDTYLVTVLIVEPAGLIMEESGTCWRKYHVGRVA